jgi:hypothetical protein
VIWRDELNDGKIFLCDIIDLEASFAGPGDGAAADRDHGAGAFLVGFALADGDAKALGAFLYIGDVERDDLRPPGTSTLVPLGISWAFLSFAVQNGALHNRRPYGLLT